MDLTQKYDNAWENDTRHVCGLAAPCSLSFFRFSGIAPRETQFTPPKQPTYRKFTQQTQARAILPLAEAKKKIPRFDFLPL